MIMIKILIFFLGISLTISQSVRPQPKNVAINKCCRIGETLEYRKDNNTPSCVIGGSEKWYPKILLIARQKVFTPAGDAPKHISTSEDTFPKTCEHPMYIHGPDNFVIYSNGSIHLFSYSINLVNTDYCAERESVLVCFDHMKSIPDPLIKHIKYISKIQKCCSPNSVYLSTNSSCLNLKRTTGNREHNHPRKIINSSNVDIIYGFPECSLHDYAIAGKYDVKNYEETTGILKLDSGKLLQWNQYCLERQLHDLDNINIFSCSDHFTSPELAPVEQNDMRFVVFAIGLLISVIFLIATLIASFLVPSNHHVLHWRCQTHYVACLLVGDFLLAITQISGNSIAGTSCVTIAILMHFFFLAAFFWLNCMCFNIWWTFRDFRPTSLEKGQELCRLRIYEVYAWGVPLLISGVATILDNLPESANETFLRPRFGEKTCWFYGDMEMLTYFFGPIGILLCVNLLLFASTARQLTCGLWKRDDVKSTTERAALGRVCMKLVVVMGVTWTADVISWAVGGPSYLWIVTDLINALQGVLIFIVVGCQPQVWSAIKRLWTSKTGRGNNTTTNGPQHSSSSHGLPSMGESVTNNTTTNTITSTKVPLETIC